MCQPIGECCRHEHAKPCRRHPPHNHPAAHLVACAALEVGHTCSVWRNDNRKNRQCLIRALKPDPSAQVPHATGQPAAKRSRHTASWHANTEGLNISQSHTQPHTRLGQMGSQMNDEKRAGCPGTILRMQASQEIVHAGRQAHACAQHTRTTPEHSSKLMLTSTNRRQLG